MTERDPDCIFCSIIAGDIPGARELAERAFEIRRAVLRPGHPALAQCLTLLVETALAAGEHERALAFCREVSLLLAVKTKTKVQC